MASIRGYVDEVPEVVADGHISFDQLVKKFLKVSAGAVRDAKRRRFFYPTPTRSARKRRGKITEIRRRERRQLERAQGRRQARR